jgi:hypothetical protein
MLQMDEGPRSGDPFRLALVFCRCECSTCGYTVRITRKWLTLAGPPICPTDRVALVAEGGVKTPAAA